MIQKCDTFFCTDTMWELTHDCWIFVLCRPVIEEIVHILECYLPKACHRRHQTSKPQIILTTGKNQSSHSLFAESQTGAETSSCINYGVGDKESDMDLSSE